MYGVENDAADVWGVPVFRTFHFIRGHMTDISTAQMGPQSGGFAPVADRPLCRSCCMSRDPSVSSSNSHLAVKVKRPGERRSLSRTATRALDVMELFGASRQALRAVEIGKVLDITPSSTNQLLKTMVDSGHLVFNARTKTYLPSPRLAKFSGWIVEMYGPGGPLRDLIRGIHEELDMVVTVSTPNDLFMQIIDSAIPDGKTAERGLRISLFGSTIGDACLSMLDDEEIARLAYRARIDTGDLGGIMERVASIREHGFSQGPSMDDSIWSIAMPLPREGLPVPAVLGLAGPADAVRPRASELVEMLQRAIGDYRRAAGPEESDPA